MPKFYGPIGYAVSTETTSGVFTDVITERNYYGEILRDTKQWVDGKQLNDNLTVSNRISVIADDFANTNFSAMRYVKWSGVLWNINNIESQRPRLILSLGGVYNGPTP